MGLILIGVVIGMVSGCVGIGGGILVIPALMLLFGFTQERANGTSLAMLLPPIGLFAAMSYWRAGNVDVRFALLLAIGFAAGAYFGARAVNLKLINAAAVRMGFVVLLYYVATRMLFQTLANRGQWSTGAGVISGSALAGLLSLRRKRRKPDTDAPSPVDFEI